MKTRLAHIGLVVVWLFIGLGLAEVYVRVFRPHTRDPIIPGHVLRIDDDLGWTLRPETEGAHHTRYFDVVYTINSQGFRDKPRSADAANGATKRILLYGDSLVFGWGILDGLRFADLIERREGNLELWNRAVVGYGLDQEIIAYEKEGQFLPVDEVMFFVASTTLSRVHSGFMYAKYKPMFRQEEDGSLTLVPVPRAKNAVLSLLYEALSPFRLPYFLQNEFARFQEALRSRSETGIVRSGRAPFTSRDRISGFEKELLRKALRVARRRHQQMTVLAASLPLSEMKELHEFSRENGIGYVEIGPELSATPTTDEHGDFIFGRDDHHWTVKANALIAQQLGPQLRREETN